MQSQSSKQKLPNLIGRIKIGTTIMQDHRCMKWPNCFPPKKEYLGEEYKYEAKNPDMYFEIVCFEEFCECIADGYGSLREGESYGNGSIFVLRPDSVIFCAQDTN